jgi:hypothetical protein
MSEERKIITESKLEQLLSIIDVDETDVPAMKRWLDGLEPAPSTFISISVDEVLCPTCEGRGTICCPKCHGSGKV